MTFRRKLYFLLDSLQADLDEWIAGYNTERTHQGKMCCGKALMATVNEGKQLWTEYVSKLNGQFWHVKREDCQIKYELQLAG